MHSMQVNFDRMTQIAGNHASELGIFPAERNQWNLLNQSLPPHQGQPSRQRKDTLPRLNYRSVDHQASPAQKKQNSGKFSLASELFQRT